MQWLSLAEEMGLESGNHSMHSLLHSFLKTITQHKDAQHQWNMMRRLFSFLESNAGVFWEVPSLLEFVDRHRKSEANETDKPEESLDLDRLFDDDEEDESSIFQAAYDNVVFRDSADDGNDGDTVDEGYGPGTTEFELIYRQLEPRLKFLHTVGSLWSSAAISLSKQLDGNTRQDPEQQSHIREWLTAIRRFLKELGNLVTEVRDYEIQTYSATFRNLFLK